MKKALSRIGCMLALACIALTQPVRAQEPLLVNIPFAFTAGKMALPAGEYRVEKLTKDGVTLLIQRTDHRASVFVLSNTKQANAPQTQSKLVFHRYGNRYFLSQVWTAGYSRGRELQPSAKEKEQALLARNGAPDQVTIVARLVSPKY